jgi:ABC-2 type transport system permease protein
MLPVYLAAYVILPGTLGAILCLLIVNYFPQRRLQALAGLLLLLASAAAFWAWRVIAVMSNEGLGNRDALQRIFDMFELAKSHYSPSQWMSQGLLALARRDVAASLLPLALLWSNALLLYVLAAYMARRIYRRGVNRISGGFGVSKIYGGSRLDGFMNLLVCYLDPKTRLLVVKDFRTFRREPVQVGQLALFAGLMLLCVANMRQFFGADLPVINQYFISLLNLCATGLLMCAYIGRFIYPLISLEGRKFWILGLLPLKREQLLWGKFAFAVTMTTVLASGIILLSDLVLNMPFAAIIIHLLTLCVLSFGLSGMGVGMSAWMPNFRETDPSKIVVGFGGTMFTIASLIYLVVAVVLMCVPYHLASAREFYRPISEPLPWWVFAGIPVGMIMAFLAAWLPMRIGARMLRDVEF